MELFFQDRQLMNDEGALDGCGSSLQLNIFPEANSAAECFRLDGI